MDSTSPSKDTAWQTGLQMEIQKSVVYRSLMSWTQGNTGLGWKAGGRFTKPMAPENRKEWQYYIRLICLILISDKLDFKLTHWWNVIKKDTLY
jgi:hypothetical protein